MGFLAITLLWVASVSVGEHQRGSLSSGLCSSVSSKQVTHLYKRFRKLDRGEKGVIATKDFYMIPELAMNPIAPRLAEVVGMSGGTAVNFREFLRFLSLFGEQNSHSDQRIQRACIACTSPVCALLDLLGQSLRLWRPA